MIIYNYIMYIIFTFIDFVYTLYNLIQFCTKFCIIFIYTHIYIFVYHIYLADKLFPFLLFFRICWEKKRKLSEPVILKLEVICHS